MSTNATRSRRPVFARPFALALVVALANVAKPVVIDDTAYLAYARHIATNPLDPYGFDIFWYVVPEPAFGVLAPPVVPYWLGLGIALFGEYPGLLKLWMFPFVWVFAWAVGELLRRFARGAESRLLPLIVLSPAVLPTVNLMLDIPALGLGFAAVAVFARAVDRASWRGAAAAGLLAGVAMQTKYTALLIPPALLWFGATHRAWRPAAVSVAVAAVVFAGWEGFLLEKYGRSHFVHHVAAQRSGEGTSSFLREKSLLAGPLVGHLGCLGVGVGLAAGAALGVAGRWLVGGAVVWTVGFLAVLFLPYQATVISDGNPPDTAAALFWQTSGALFLVGVAACAAFLGVRSWRPVRFRRNRGTAFLVGWVLIELAGYFALTPFGAARRVIGMVVVGGLLAGRALSRGQRLRPPRRLPPWVVWFGVAAGGVVAALDAWDAFPEKYCAEAAAAVAAGRPPGATAWYVGHWGFQFYSERAGMKPVVPGQTVLMPGDFLALPVAPPGAVFARPHVVWPIEPPGWVAEPVAEAVWDDFISGQTVWTFYGGDSPVIGRDHPRLRVVVYRIVRPWVVGQ